MTGFFLWVGRCGRGEKFLCGFCKIFHGRGNPFLPVIKNKQIHFDIKACYGKESEIFFLQDRQGCIFGQEGDAHLFLQEMQNDGKAGNLLRMVKGCTVLDCQFIENLAIVVVFLGQKDGFFRQPLRWYVLLIRQRMLRRGDKRNGNRARKYGFQGRVIGRTVGKENDIQIALFQLII